MAPERIEQVYLQSPLINQIFVDGSGLRSHPVALIVPNADCICQKLNSNEQQAKISSVRNNNENSENCNTSGSFNTLAELRNDSEVEQLIFKEIIQLGKEGGLMGFEQVRAVFTFRNV